MMCVRLQIISICGSAGTRINHIQTRHIQNISCSKHIIYKMTYRQQIICNLTNHHSALLIPYPHDAWRPMMLRWYIVEAPSYPSAINVQLFPPQLATTYPQSIQHDPCPFNCISHLPLMAYSSMLAFCMQCHGMFQIKYATAAMYFAPIWFQCRHHPFNINYTFIISIPFITAPAGIYSFKWFLVPCWWHFNIW